MNDITQTLLVAFVACTWTIARSQINGTEYEDSVILSSLMNNIFDTRKVHINLIAGNLYDLKSGGVIYSLGLTSFNTRLLSLDADYARSRLYILDANTAAIYAIKNFNWKENFTNMSLKLIHDGVSRYSARLAVDWVSNNVYWTDPLFGWIVVQSGSKEDTYKILVDDDLEKPYALAVDPVHKQMFWSDIGSTIKIERASLSGTDRQTIISTGLAFPRSIDIDQTANKLVFVDSSRDTLETANFDGTQRKVIRRMSHTEFYDVAIFKDLVGVTDFKNGSFTIFNKNSGAIIDSFERTSGEPFVAVALYSAYIQPTQNDLCLDYGCSDICVNNKDRPVCLCKEGYKLNQDGLQKTCSVDTGKFHRAFMWSNSSSICMMDIRSLTSNRYTDSADCFLNGGTSVSHFDIDMSERKVVFVDGTDIYSVNIEQNPVKSRLISATHTVTGIAIDWRDENVYWCMGETAGEINVFSRETETEYTLISTNLTYPKSLTILPFQNIMLWISGTAGSNKLEKSKLDGSDREVLVSSTSSGGMKGLTVDYSTNTLYFIDDWLVKRCDIEGKQMTTFTPESALLPPMKVLPYKNYLIVADTDFPSSVIKVYEKKSVPVQITTINSVTPTDMHVLDALLHPEQKGPCAILNGGCEHICIPIGSNRVCQCEYGFQLDSNKKTCSSSVLTDNFVLVTDWTHNKIYQLSLVNDEVRAVDTKTYGSPTGIAYNHMTQQLIWSSNELVHRISLNGTGYQVILNTEMFGSHADRFAIDYPSGNIYYTANPASLTGFVGVGMISPGGLHKRLISIGVRPRDIVLDSEDGLLFWTDHGIKPAFVRKAHMDGSNMAYVISSGLVWPNGLAIDTKANLLYVTDGGTNKIYRCTYQGVTSCKEYYTDNEAHLMDVALFGDYLYYTAWNRPYVTKLHKTNLSMKSKVGYRPELGRLDSLSLYSSAVQPSESANCFENNGRGPCSTFCLPKPAGYKCSCEDSVNLLSDGKTCENVELQTTLTTSTKTARTTSATTSPLSTITTPLAPSSSTATAASTITGATSAKASTTSTKYTTSSSINVSATTTTEKAAGLPVAAIAGASVGFALLILVIVVLVIVILKRSNKKNNNQGNQSTNPYETGFDISFVTTPATESQRPDSTYDLIRFDDVEDPTPSNKENHDNTQNDYMSLLRRQKDYEQLSFMKTTEPSQEFRPSAIPNEYHIMADTAAAGSAQPADDYMEPIHTIQP